MSKIEYLVESRVVVFLAESAPIQKEYVIRRVKEQADLSGE